MITSESGLTHIKGPRVEILADLSVIVSALRDDFSDEEIKKSIDMAFKSDRELKIEVMDMIEEVFNRR